MSETNRPRFDPTVNLGHLITLSGMIAVFIGSWYLMDHRLASVERQLDRLSIVVIDNARMDQRVTEHGRRLDRLEAK